MSAAEVPAGTTAGGDNPADPGVTQATAGDPVNTENGDFTESDTDLSVPTFGPSLAWKNLEPCGADHRWGFLDSYANAGTTQNRADAGDQFPRRAGFGYVVIGAKFQPDYPVSIISFCR